MLSSRLTVALMLAALLSAGAATAGDFSDADLHNKLGAYQEHLQRAMDIYGQGFYDPAYHQKLAGFDQDIRTGDPSQSEKIKRAVFASMLMTAGVHLDPDPLHDWAEVEKSLDQLRSHWQSIARQAEKDVDLAESLRPTKLSLGQTFAGQVTEGLNLHFVLLGVEFGHPMANVNALIQLTYSGRTEAGHMFLLTALTEAHEKTRTDTWVRSRSILMYSDAADLVRYGHAVSAQDHGDYRVPSALVADVVPTTRDWIWKSLAAPDAPAATLPDLERTVQRVQDSKRAIDAAVKAFQQLSLRAVRENDEALTEEASSNRRKAQLPEQDLKDSSPDVRARLYAVRALSADDSRFRAALEAVNAARRQVEASIDDARERFGYFNRIATYTAPELPWKNVQRLAAQLMNVAEDVRRAREVTNESVPAATRTGESSVTIRSNLIVEQVNRGQGTPLMMERILLEVHWSVKGIPRREYTSELIDRKSVV
jgi:hypothetical protein